MSIAMIVSKGFRAAILAFFVLGQVSTYAGDVSQSVPAVVRQLMQKDLSGLGGKEAVMLSVEYIPGGASLPHRHDAQVFVYVLEGELIMQVAGSTAVKVRPGDTFYEGTNDVHLTSANASTTAAAKILVFIVKDKSAPLSREVTAKAMP